MTNVERHQFILKKLEEQQSITVQELFEELQVSTVTIRKDLSFLEQSGLLFRSHGGATKYNPYTTDRTVFEKEKLFTEEKTAIGKLAASLIHENDSVIIGSGTTTQAMARQIMPKGQITVVTSALNVSLELIKHQNIDILQLGGYLRKSSTSVTGKYAEEVLSNFYFSKVFLGIDGLELDYGISTTNATEAQLNRKMISSAQTVILVTDSSKFGRKSFGKISDLDAIDIIITDKGLNEKYKSELSRLGIKVLIA